MVLQHLGDPCMAYNRGCGQCRKRTLMLLLLLLLLNTFIQNRKGDKNASLGGYITPVRKSSLKYKYSTDTYKATEKYINHQSLDKQ